MKFLKDFIYVSGIRQYAYFYESLLRPNEFLVSSIFSQKVIQHLPYVNFQILKWLYLFPESSSSKNLASSVWWISQPYDDTFRASKCICNRRTLNQWRIHAAHLSTSEKHFSYYKPYSGNILSFSDLSSTYFENYPKHWFYTLTPGLPNG